MNEVMKIENIENMIYEIRGKQVMLASDVANLYKVETKALNQTIKRNINRFPNSFCFQLTNKEIDELSLRSQFATLNKSNNMRGQHYKYLPYVLTEQGIMMLSGLLKSDIAVKVNIRIIDAFVKMRHIIGNNEYRLSNVETKVIEHDKNIKLLQESLDKLNEKSKLNTILFDGQVYDAYSLLLDILNESREEIILIDNYAGKELLDMLKNINKKIIIVSSNIDDTLKHKYELQYKNVIFKNNNTFHDRFIIIDRSKLYSCGASFKDLGKKCFSIHEIDSNEIIDNFIKRIEVKNEYIKLL